MPQGVERQQAEEQEQGQTITVPTHLNIQDTVVRFGQVKVTSRQFVLLLAGGSLLYTLWLRTAWLETALATIGTALHWSLAVVSIVGVLSLTFGVIAGRTLDIWLLLLLVYWLRPKVYVWSSLNREAVIEQLEDDIGEHDVNKSGERHNVYEQQTKEEVVL